MHTRSDSIARPAHQGIRFPAGANGAQVFGRDAAGGGAGFAENSPAIYGWEQRKPIFQVPPGTADRFFRP